MPGGRGLIGRGELCAMVLEARPPRPARRSAARRPAAPSSPAAPSARSCARSSGVLLPLISWVSHAPQGGILAAHLRPSRGVVTESGDIGPLSVLGLTGLLWCAGTVAAQVNVLIAQRGDHLHAGQTAQSADGADCNTAATSGVIPESICGVTSELPVMLLRQLRHGVSPRPTSSIAKNPLHGGILRLPALLDLLVRAYAGRQCRSLANGRPR